MTKAYVQVKRGSKTTPGWLKYQSPFGPRPNNGKKVLGRVYK